eukprot:3128718-Rhodomonas_salina.1
MHVNQKSAQMTRHKKQPPRERGESTEHVMLCPIQNALLHMTIEKIVALHTVTFGEMQAGLHELCFLLLQRIIDHLDLLRNEERNGTATILDALTVYLIASKFICTNTLTLQTLVQTLIVKAPHLTRRWILEKEIAFLNILNWDVYTSYNQIRAMLPIVEH